MSIDATAMRLWDGVTSSPIKVVVTPFIDVEAVAQQEAKLLAKVRRETLKIQRQTNTLVRQLRRRETPDGQVIPADATPYRTRQHARTRAKSVGWNAGTGNGARNPQPLPETEPSTHSVGFSFVVAVEYTTTMHRQRSKALALAADREERRRLKRIRRYEAKGLPPVNPTLQITNWKV